MSNVLDEIMQTGMVQSTNGEFIKLAGNIPQKEGKFLQKLILEFKPKISLEVGLAFGISSLYICEALTQIGGERHIVIDPWQNKDDSCYKGIGLNNLKKAGYENLIDFMEMSSHIALPKLESEGVKVDFAFIDGWHTFDYVLMDFFFIDRLLRVGGVVAFDDVPYYGSIQKVCRYIATNRAYTIINKDTEPPKHPQRTQKLLKVPLISRYLKRIVKLYILY
jgi:predicted O-methyltransferase YrrM